MNRTWIGLGLLAVVALGALALSVLDFDALRRAAPSGPEPAAVSFYYGGEKSALLANPAVRDILGRRHRLTLDARRAGSVEMATTLDPAGIDCLWPSNAAAADYARRAGRRILAEETVFNSPIVLYAWDDVAAALAAKGVVAERDGFLRADLERLVALIVERARWREDLGLPLYGTVKVFSTDPTRSNSGNIWAALLATVLNGGETPTAESLGPILPRLRVYFDAMGFMESSSGDIFENFLKQGMGARPIIVGYENQLVEFLRENAAAADLITQRIRVIYPEPTAFASHPVLSLTPACARLAQALGDPELQQIAWREHGFRTGLIGVENDPAAIGAARLPDRVEFVAPSPDAAAMEAILDALR